MKKKINSNGFAIAGLLYSLLIIFLALIFSFLLMLNNRKTILNQIKKDVYNNLSGITSDEISIDLDDLPSILVEGSDYKLPSNVSSTLKDNSNISCKVDNNEITNVSTLHSGYYNVECQITVGNKNDIVQKEILIISKGTTIYFNPETGKVCNQADVVSTTGTKSGCMKWYIYSDNNKNNFNMILDHNTTAVVAWNSTNSNSEMKEVKTALDNDTSTWDSSLSARLIDADEIAHIVGADRDDTLKWSADKVYGTSDINKNSAYFYFDGSGTTYAEWQKNVANSTNKSKYAWLYDYTNNCTIYGCNIADSGNSGYWTSTSVKGFNNYSWRVYLNGGIGAELVNSDKIGLRPVITVNKSDVSNLIDLSDIPNVLVEGSSYTISEKCSINDNIVSNTSSLQVGNYKISCQGFDGNNIDKINKEILVISKGTSVYFNPKTGNVCNQNDAVSTTGTKTGCMKWYIYSDNNKNNFNMILDHNTTAVVAWNSTGSNSEMKEAKTALDSDTSTWVSSLNARLINADEVAHIVGADRDDTLKWSSTKPSGNTDIENYSADFYFDGSGLGYSGWQSQVANSTNKSKYAWLYDRTKDCINYGCNISDSSNSGYWTSTSIVNGKTVRLVNRIGTLGNDNPQNPSYRGIRPVVTVNKSIFYK